MNIMALYCALLEAVTTFPEEEKTFGSALLTILLQASHFSTFETAQALTVAAGGDHLEAVEKLLVAKADVNLAT